MRPEDLLSSEEVFAASVLDDDSAAAGQRPLLSQVGVRRGVGSASIQVLDFTVGDIGHHEPACDVFL